MLMRGFDGAIITDCKLPTVRHSEGYIRVAVAILAFVNLAPIVMRDIYFREFAGFHSAALNRLHQFVNIAHGQ